ncbi:MAG: carbonic anhydrase [Bryobacteraceae bacterium]
MKKLIEGVARFQREVYPTHRTLFKDLASSQNPRWLFITCADSRIDPSLLTQTRPGELFICRNAGNIVPAYGHPGGITATIEYAVMALEVRHIVVCGHSDCGAMKGILCPDSVKDMPTVAQWLRFGDSARMMVEENYSHLVGEAQLRALTEQNVVAQIDNLRTHPAVSSRIRQKRLQIHGWFYDIGDGSMKEYLPQKEAFVELTPEKMEEIYSLVNGI